MLILVNVLSLPISSLIVVLAAAGVVIVVVITVLVMVFFAMVLEALHHLVNKVASAIGERLKFSSFGWKKRVM